jgi:hypothetical protein
LLLFSLPPATTSRFARSISLVIISSSRNPIWRRKEKKTFFYQLILLDQGCQTVYFQTKNPNLCKFCRILQWKMLVYFMAI